MFTYLMLLCKRARQEIDPNIQTQQERVYLRARASTRGEMDRSLMVNPLNYFSFKPVLHDWINNGRGMCYSVYGMMRIKYPLLLSLVANVVAAAGFLSRYLSGPLPYVRRHITGNKMR